MSWKSLPSAYNLTDRAYWFGQADGRPLALFRIALGLILLKDALFHLPLATLFYSDAGLLPRAVLLSEPLRPQRIALLDYLGAPWAVTLFFLLWAAVIVAFTAGYRTRLAAILNYIFLLSVHYRNPDILNGADELLRSLSFWAIFLRLDTHYAVGAGDGRSPYADRFPWRLAQLQMALVYLMAGLFKVRSGAWLAGDALHYTFQLTSRTWPLGDWLLLNMPETLIYLAAVATVFVELAFPLLVLAPFAQPALRLYGLLLGVLLHVAISLTLAIPNFSAVMIASYLLFWEPEWVDWLMRAMGRPVSATPLPRPRPIPSATRAALRLLAAFAFASILWVNLRGVGQPWVPTVREPARSFLLWTGQIQRWNMFASGGPREDTWLAVDGELADGREVDLQNGQVGPPVRPDRRWGSGARWLKAEENLAEAGPGRLAAWAAYACRLEHNREYALVAVYVTAYRRPSVPPGAAPPGGYAPVRLWQGSCPSVSD